VFPASAHCSRILKEFFQTLFACWFFFTAHLNKFHLTAKRCRSVDVRANFKRMFHRSDGSPRKGMRDSTNQAHGLIRTEPDVLQSYASKKFSERNMLAPMERWRTARLPKNILS
jgi:hypothetical protein